MKTILTYWRLYAAVLSVAVLASVIGLLYASQSTSRQISECKISSNKALCYTNTINDTLTHKDLPAALDFVAAAYDADADFAGFCHANTHDLGKAAYQEFHRMGLVTLNSKTTYCAYGFYHGFMEEMLAQTGNFAEARAFCAYAGEQVPNPPRYTEGACYHGIGHGVTDGYDPRLWGDARALAAPGLDTCAKVASSTNEWQQRCASGVFNSIALLYRDSKYKLNTDNPFTLCGGLYTVLQKEACYNQMNTLATYMAKDNLAQSIAYTHAIQSAKYRIIALQGVTGFYIQTLKFAHQSVSPKEVSNACGALPAALSEACIQGLIGGIMEFGQPTVQYKEGVTLCSAPDLSPSLRSVCFKQLASLSSLFYPKERLQTVCREIPTEYLDSACGAVAAPTQTL